MVPFDRAYTTYYWPAMVTIALFCIIFEFFDVKICDLEIWVWCTNLVSQPTCGQKLKSKMVVASVLNIYFRL